MTGDTVASRGDKIVYTSGSWDLFHIGHLNVLEKSSSYGSKLIVGVSTDELVESYKGVKPIIPFEERMRIIDSLAMVDETIKQTVLMDVRILKAHKIDIATIGDDWIGKSLHGLDWMKANGEVIYLPYTRHTSTTLIKRKIINKAYDLIRAELERELAIDLPDNAKGTESE